MNFRRNSGLTQRIYLVKLRIEGDCHTFDVLGTSSKVYEVTLTPKTITCTCPDHVYRKSFCKHMYFLSERVFSLELMQLRFSNMALFKKRMLQKLNHLHSENDKVQDDVPSFHRNETCVVCFDDFIVSDVLQTCSVCENSLHDECWKRFCESGRSKNCVYCRTPVPSKDLNNKNTNVIMKDFVVE
jgi:hypothetical protein